MNTDIRLSVGFWQHPKTRKLVKRLGLEGVRSLQILWLWAAQNRPDGILLGMDWEDIELAADWQGEEHAFFEHCIGVWIDEDDGVYSLHDWAEHNPWQAEALLRSEQNRQNAKSGWEKRRAKQPHANGNAENMQPQCDRNATAKQPDANRNAPFLTFPKESFLTASASASPPDTASPDGAADKKLSSLPEGIKPPDCYEAKSGRKLQGQKLQDFLSFWQAFAFPKGKREAADAWLGLPDYSPQLVGRICEAARQEALDRPAYQAKGQNAKWAAGWLELRRWEDYMPAQPRAPARQEAFDRELDEAERRKAQEVRKRLEAEWRAKREAI